MTSATETKTLYDLLTNGAPEKTAILVPGGPAISYASLRRQVAALAEQLKGLGVKRGDRVATVLPNSPECIISFLAAATAGTAAPLNAAYKADEFQFYLEDTKAKVLITPPSGAEAALGVASADITRVAVTMDERGEVSFQATGASKGKANDGMSQAEDVALVLHTSGTTSRPKRVPLKHRNLLASVANIVKTYGLTPADSSFCIMPLFHVHGLMASTMSTLSSGGTVVVPGRFNPLNFWPAVRDSRATWFTAVPTMHNALLARARGANQPASSYHQTLRFIRSCSAPLSPVTMKELEERFGVPVLEAYGMTEASHQMSSNPLPPAARKPGSVGPGTGVQIAIMDEEGKLLANGAQGEVVIKGPNVITGYEDNPQANATSFTNGWFRTGDEGILDSQNYLTLVARIKELINRSGEKISPVEIDEVLLSHPAVAEAVAFAAPSATHGEEPAAAVVLSGQVTEAELMKHCRERLADFKVPRTIYIVQQIPRTATGKVQRRAVSEALIKK